MYEDEYLIVFDKPPGLLVIPSPKKEKNTLTDIVNRQHPVGQEGRLHPCHRLDRETSGVIVYARGKSAQQAVMAEFHRQAVDKTYVAFVRGRIEKPRGHIESRILDRYDGRFGKNRDGGRPGKDAGRKAVTDYRVRSAGPDFSVVEVYPRTGRTNQIRIHFREIGHPLLGERVYAFGKDFPVRFRRLALHAQRISLRHPVTGASLVVNSDLPGDMKEFLARHGG